jgi:hypothetical protein
MLLPAGYRDPNRLVFLRPHRLDPKQSKQIVLSRRIYNRVTNERRSLTLVVTHLSEMAENHPPQRGKVFEKSGRVNVRWWDSAGILRTSFGYIHNNEAIHTIRKDDYN